MCGSTQKNCKQSNSHFLSKTFRYKQHSTAQHSNLHFHVRPIKKTENSYNFPVISFVFAGGVALAVLLFSLFIHRKCTSWFSFEHLHDTASARVYQTESPAVTRFAIAVIAIIFNIAIVIIVIITFAFVKNFPT